MPLLTPLRRRGSKDPMLKEANYFQYLPHSREARSSRGQACETFLQPSLLCPPFSSFIYPPPAHLSPLASLSHLASLTFLFPDASILIALSNIHSVIYVHSVGEVHVFSHSSLIFVWQGVGIYCPT